MCSSSCSGPEAKPAPHLAEPAPHLAEPAAPLAAPVAASPDDPRAALRPLGWGDWFARRVPEAGTDAVARVIAVDRGLLLLADATQTFRARLAGRYRQHHPDPADRPCVGDWVCIEPAQADGHARVQARLPRRSTLCRRAAGSAATTQMIAANVDEVLIAQGCDTDFNLKRMERYLVMVREGGARATVLLTKTDLVAPGTMAARVAALRAAGIGTPVLTMNLLAPEGADALAQRLQPGMTYCVAGSSGVGKSTLINLLAGRVLQHTGAVSGSGEGRHTTVRRQLITLPCGALMIDTPGMREFGLTDATGGLAECYADLAELAAGCRFRNCRHEGEPGCAVQAALLAGTLHPAHLDNYRTLQGEAGFYAMTATERRHKDRAFGRRVNATRKAAAGRWGGAG